MYHENLIKSRRDRLKIIIDVLNIALEPAVKTRILYGANINFKILKKYLDFLQENKLIEKIEVKYTTYYKTTDTGKAILKHYNKIQKIMKTDDELSRESIIT